MATFNDLQTLASGPETGSPAKSPAKSLVKMQRLSSPPPLLKDISETIEDGEIVKQQDNVGSLRTHLQLSAFEYSALEDRFVRLQRQHRELQDLASAYSDVIQGCPSAHTATVSIDQLQLEAGRDGLRAKALEAEVFKPLVREAGGLQALVFQMNVMRAIIDKAGGIRDLEQFVSDVCTVRDALGELHGPQGLADVVSEVRDLLKIKRDYDVLQAEVHGHSGLRAKAARYERLMQAVHDVQSVESIQQPYAGCDGMNPARARMISATPLEADPDRDLYDAPPPVAKPNNKTGSNNTPLGPSQAKPTSKRFRSKKNQPSMPGKRLRLDVDRASALMQACLPTGTDGSARRSTQPSIDDSRAGGVAAATDIYADRFEKESLSMGAAASQYGLQTAAVPPRLSDWLRPDARFGDAGFMPIPEVPRYPLTASAQDIEPYDRESSSLVSLSAGMTRSGAQMAMQKVAVLNPHYNQPINWNDHLIHPVAFWVGASDASAAWDAHQSYNLKRNFQVPDDLLAALTEELSKHISIEKFGTYETMLPSQDTCILSCLVDGHRTSGLARERIACEFCTHHSRPCALLQDIGSIRTIVFMPLHPEIRSGLKWSDKAYWVQAA